MSRSESFSCRPSFAPAFIILLCLCASPIALATPMATLAERLPDQGEIHLGLYNGETPDGFMRLGWQRNGDSLQLYDRTMMPSMEVYETMEAQMSGQDFAPVSTQIRFHQRAAIMHIDVQTETGLITGERRVAQPGQSPSERPIEHNPQAPYLLRATSFILPLVMEQSAGNVLAYSWYAPLSDAVQPVTLTVREAVTVDTPGGQFETFRIELRGGVPENDIFVTRGENPRVVRIDVLGQPLQFLALPETDDSAN